MLLSLSSSLYYAYFTAFKRQIETNTDLYIEVSIEIIFFFEMVMRFFLEYTPRDSFYPIKDIRLIALIYFKTQFFFDLLPLVPLPHIFDMKYSRFLWLIKCMRLTKFHQILNIRTIMKQVKQFFQYRISKIINDPNLCDEIEVDNNKIL